MGLQEPNSEEVKPRCPLPWLGMKENKIVMITNRVRGIPTWWVHTKNMDLEQVQPYYGVQMNYSDQKVQSWQDSWFVAQTES